MTPSRTVQLRALLPALVRSARWQPLFGATVAAVVLLWWRRADVGDPVGAVWLLRAVAVLLALGLVFALDDRTRPTVAAVPTPLWWRASMRLLVLGLPAAVVWVAVLAWVGSHVDGTLPVAGLTVEAATLAAVGAAVAGALAAWRGTSEPGGYAGPVLLGLALTLPRLPERVALAVLPGAGWGGAHARWSSLLALAAFVLLAGLRDPASPWLRRPRQAVEGEGGRTVFTHPRRD